jgi:hypothetical protein
LSHGSVISATTIDRIIPNISNNDLNTVWEVKSLLIGGYILINTIRDSQNNHFIYGYLYDRKEADYIPWEFPEPVQTNLNGVYQILPHNNTLLVAQMEKNNSWQFQVIDLSKFALDEDNGYFNPNVVFTFPAINSSIDPNNLKFQTFSIKFKYPVEVSDGSLSIYQVIDDRQYFRQSISCIPTMNFRSFGSFCSLYGDRTLEFIY